MDARFSQADEALFDPVTKISQVLNEKNQEMIENEAVIIYSKLEINKLQAATKELNEQTQKLEAETATFQKQIKELDVSIDINRKSLEIKSDMHINFKQEICRLETEIKEQVKRNETVYNEYLEKYKTERNAYETYHPLFKQVNQLRLENLKLEVLFKILQAKIFEKKKQIENRREIHKKIFNATIVKFAENTLHYWKTRNLECQLDEATKKEISLLQQLHDVQLLAGKMDKELRMTKRTSVLNETSKIKNTEFMTEQNWKEINNNNNENVVISAPISTPPCLGSFNPVDNRFQSEEMLLQIRARCEQRQRQWENQRSFSSTLNRQQTLQSANRNPKRQMPVAGQTDPHGQKRSLQPTNLPSQNSQFKVPKSAANYNIIGNENTRLINQQMVQNITPISAGDENTAFGIQNSKVKIISVHSIGSNENPIVMNQHSFQKSSMPQNINKNLYQVISQQTPHYLAKPPQNYPSENIISQVQPQETNNNMLTPSTTMAPPKQSQGYHPQNFLPEEINRTAQSIHKGAAPIPSHPIAQAPLGYHSENVPLSQLAVSQMITQEHPQIKPGCIDPYPSTQFETGGTQNLTDMILSGKQATQASDKSVDNTGGTSQSSTFSQKCTELQRFLNSELQEPVYVPAPAPQVNVNKAVEPALTSPFFNKPKPGETANLVTQPHENTTVQEPPSQNDNVLMSPANMTQYLDTSGIFYNQEGENTSYFEDDYPQILSPEYNENNPSAAQPEAQPPGFSFNFGQPQTKQAAEMKFTFSNNNATTSTPFFNMF